MDADLRGILFCLTCCCCYFFTLLNAFFAGAEMAVVSVNKNRIRSMADEGNKKAKVIEGLFEDSTKFLSTIQVAITFAGFYSSASAASGISPVLAQSLEAAGVPYSSQIAYNGVTLVLMFFNLVFGRACSEEDRAAESGSVLYVYGNAGTLYIDHTVSVYQTSFHVYEACVKASWDENGR